jgi:hypothetical protein
MLGYRREDDLLAAPGPTLRRRVTSGTCRGRLTLASWLYVAVATTAAVACVASLVFGGVRGT